MEMLQLGDGLSFLFADPRQATSSGDSIYVPAMDMALAILFLLGFLRDIPSRELREIVKGGLCLDCHLTGPNKFWGGLCAEQPT